MSNFLVIITLTTDSLRRNLEVRKGGSLYLLRCLQSKIRSTPKHFHFCSPGKLFCNSPHNVFGSEDSDSLFYFLPLPGFPSSNYDASASDK